jgi:hypothetical protein
VRRSPSWRVARRGSSRTVFREGIFGCGPGHSAAPTDLKNAPPIPAVPRFRTFSGVSFPVRHGSAKMAADMSREQEPLRGERLNDGLSAVAAGTGPPLVILPGFGPGADLSVRVPRSAAWSTIALARGFRRRIHLIHRPLHPPAGLAIAARPWPPHRPVRPPPEASHRPLPGPETQSPLSEEGGRRNAATARGPRGGFGGSSPRLAAEMPNGSEYGLATILLPLAFGVASPPRRVARRGSSRTVFREGFIGCGPGRSATPND